MEGGIGFVSARRCTAPSRSRRRVEQSNFNNYRVLRMNEMPKVKCTSCRRPKRRRESGSRESLPSARGRECDIRREREAGAQLSLRQGFGLIGQARLLRSSRSKPMAPPEAEQGSDGNGMAVSSQRQALMSAESRSSPYHARCAL